MGIKRVAGLLAVVVMVEVAMVVAVIIKNLYKIE
jgi:hypothetical protein